MTILKDGFSTTIEMSGAPGILLHEKEVTPPGVDGGGEINTTTMRNNEWRTKAPKSLRDLTESPATCAYDPAVYDEIMSQLQVNQEITVTFPDGSTLTYWGWLDKFVPNAHVEGEQPTAEVTFIPSNQDNSGVEQAPVYAA